MTVNANLCLGIGMSALGFNRFFQSLNEFSIGNAYGLAEDSKFDDIDPAFTPFAAANKRLGFLNLFCKLDLSESGFLSCLDEAFQKDKIFLSIYRFLHRGAR